MESDTHQGFCRPAGGQKQRWRFVHRDTELPRKRVSGPFRLDAQSNDEIEVPGVSGCIEDLGQFVEAIERESANAIIEVGLGYGGSALHRMHELHPSAGRMFGDQLDFRDGSDVKPVNASLVQRPDCPGRRVGLDSVKNVAAEICLEPARRYGQNVRPHEGDRTFRRPLTDQVQGRMIRAQFT